MASLGETGHLVYSIISQPVQELLAAWLNNQSLIINNWINGYKTTDAEFGELVPENLPINSADNNLAARNAQPEAVS